MSFQDLQMSGLGRRDVLATDRKLSTMNTLTVGMVALQPYFLDRVVGWSPARLKARDTNFRTKPRQVVA